MIQYKIIGVKNKEIKILNISDNRCMSIIQINRHISEFDYLVILIVTKNKTYRRKIFNKFNEELNTKELIKIIDWMGDK